MYRFSKMQCFKARKADLLPVVVLVVILCMAISANSEVFTEQFDGDIINERIWKLYKGKDEQNKVFLGNGKLNIHASGVNDMFPDVDDSIKVVMKKVPQGQWTITTTVRFNTDPQNNWSGIIVYDPTNQPSTDWLCLWAGHTGTSILMRGLSDNSLTSRKTILFVNNEGAELMLDKKQNTYTASFRSIGSNDWNDIGQLKIQMPGPYIVGLVTVTLTDHEKSEVVFDHFTISSDELNLEGMFAVSPRNSLTLTWGGIKNLQYQK